MNESIEVLVEGIRREAAGLSDHRLDEQLAVARVRRDVAAAHGLPQTADAWQGLTLALDDVRRARAMTAREIEDLTSPPPPLIRPMTAEELADVEWQEPPC